MCRSLHLPSTQPNTCLSGYSNVAAVNLAWMTFRRRHLPRAIMVQMSLAIRPLPLRPEPIRSGMRAWFLYLHWLSWQVHYSYSCAAFVQPSSRPSLAITSAPILLLYSLTSSLRWCCMVWLPVCFPHLVILDIHLHKRDYQRSWADSTILVILLTLMAEWVGFFDRSTVLYGFLFLCIGAALLFFGIDQIGTNSSYLVLICKDCLLVWFEATPHSLKKFWII